MINAELIGACAGFLTTMSFIPQVAKVVRERRTAGISLKMYIVFTVGVVLWLIYGFCISSASVIAANGVTAALASVILGMKLHLDHGWFSRGRR